MLVVLFALLAGILVTRLSQIMLNRAVQTCCGLLCIVFFMGASLFLVFLLKTLFL
jgi:hypothetical protein